MPMMTKNTFLLIATCFSLTACQTVEGLKKDFGSFGNSVSNKVTDIKTDMTSKKETDIAGNEAPIIISDGTCPSIDIDPQLNNMSEFYDMQKPTKGTEVSNLKLTNSKSACQVAGEFLEVNIELTFAGKLGPKAKRKDGDRPFFAYPYFVAVTDSNGEELAKELFAASVTYEKNQEKIELVETIRQKLPLNDDGSTPDYKIQIGFQLTEEQLFYNASR